jgi:hypothetical protein
VYFAASIWPFMGTFIYALDAETGIVFGATKAPARITRTSAQLSRLRRGAPQGAMVALADRLLVSGGRSVPACFDRHRKLIYYHLAEYSKTGGAFVAADELLFQSQPGSRNRLYDSRAASRGAHRQYPVWPERLLHFRRLHQYPRCC